MLAYFTMTAHDLELVVLPLHLKSSRRGLVCPALRAAFGFDFIVDFIVANGVSLDYPPASGAAATRQPNAFWAMNVCEHIDGLDRGAILSDDDVEVKEVLPGYF